MLDHQLKILPWLNLTDYIQFKYERSSYVVHNLYTLYSDRRSWLSNGGGAGGMRVGLIHKD